MLGIGQPLSEAESIARRVRGERRQDAGRIGCHGLSWLVVVAAFQDERRFGSSHLAHRHDLGDRVDELTLLIARGY